MSSVASFMPTSPFLTLELGLRKLLPHKDDSRAETAAEAVTLAFVHTVYDSMA